ncbi:MAG: endonuclease [Gammaproteobacteria bacterium]|nr:endonuclease [Gammaproteobacteria bacterium]MBU0853250.1 endonuclease [Gammaproteobacteria bacterium]MBU1459965.1 endonuclease [Gammaproteobacteria bacterium]MBU1772889.1 endonuclease [Gammaproteobacteria bacterium]|tara:strand:+ start:9366 stop:10142 length:777 start_codon:yes stop_codon:yes gene_type:complete
MPEGPSIVILREEVSAFTGKPIERVEGSAKIDKARLVGQTVRSFRSWGKHFLIELDDVSLRIHLLLFGSYRINERKESAPRLSLGFPNGELNFYGCSVQFIEGSLSEAYDWGADVMSDAWDNRTTLKKLRKRPQMLACDALLDQTLFSGSGNIIKNEVLFRTRIHPLSLIGDLPAPKLRELTREVRTYSFEFLQWKREGALKAHWLAHTKTTCPRCKIPFIRAKSLGGSKRRSFFCERCQKRYGDSDQVAVEAPADKE